MAIARPLPVTILTGFLGSGKTTLLNRLLSARHGVRLGVLVNDFGAVNIDARLVDVLQGESMSLTNGCVCCSMRGGLVATTLELLRRPQPPEALLIEASGIADPAGVAGAFRTSTLRDLTRLDGIVAMVDAEHARDPRLDSQLIAQQIRTADIVVLNKIDLVDEETCGELVAWIRSLAPGARVLPTEKAEVPVDLIMDVARPAALTAPESAHDHASTYGSWSYETAHPLAYRAVRAALAGLPADVFRAKGTLHLADAPNLRFVAQMVGRRITIEPDRPWEEEPPRTDLVLIGRPEALSVPEVVARFDACLTESFVLMPRAPFAALRRRALPAARSTVPS